MKIHMVVLDGFPESLDPNIVKSPAFSIHGDLDTLILQVLGPHCARVLAALIRVEDLRSAVLAYGILEHLQAPGCSQGVADAPAQDLATVDIHDRRQVHEPLLHRDVSDVRAPHLIGVGHLQVAQQVRPNELFQPRLGHVLAPIDGLPSHQPEQAPDALGANRMTALPEERDHRSHPLGGMDGQMSIQHVHHFQVFWFLRNRFVVDSVPANAQQITLAAYGELSMSGLQQLKALVYIPSFLQLFFKNSFSTFSWPIWA